MGEVAGYEILSLAFLLRLVLHFWGPRVLRGVLLFIPLWGRLQP